MACPTGPLATSGARPANPKRAALGRNPARRFCVTGAVLLKDSSMSIIRFALGLLLLPLCISTSLAALALVTVAQPAGAGIIPPSAYALGGGYLAWLVVYFVMPRPVRTYILAHELTHALWGAVMGARIFSVKVSKHQGSVTLSKSNFLITLAPYFFPLYTMLVIGGYLVLSWFYAVEGYYLVWLFLIGFTWGFHFTFTLSSLFQHQTDIQEFGRLFSYTVIYIGNVLGICLWVVLVSTLTIEDLVDALTHYTHQAWIFGADGLSRLYREIRQ